MTKKNLFTFAIISFLSCFLLGCYSVPKPGEVTMLFPDKKEKYTVKPKTDFLKYDYKITPEETY